MSTKPNPLSPAPSADPSVEKARDAVAAHYRTEASVKSELGLGPSPDWSLATEPVYNHVFAQRVALAGR